MGKNVLFIIDSLGAGGAEKAVLTLAKTMVSIGCRVTIISIDNITQYKIDFKVTIHTLDFVKNKIEFTYPKFGKKLENLVKELERKDGSFDLITAHLQKAHRLTALAKITNAYYCIHTTLSQANLSGRSGLRLYFKRKKLKSILDGKNIITVSAGSNNDLIQNVHIKPKTIRTIFNPLDTKSISKLAAETNLYAAENYIVHVGRFAVSKRHDILLKAYAKADIDEKLILVGDGQEKPSIQSLATELGIESKVIFAGFKHNPYPIIKGAAMFIATSEYEGFFIALAEALSLGVPVVSTNCPYGPSEILIGIFAKCLVPVGDIEGLASKIKESLSATYKSDFTVPNTSVERFETNSITQQYIDLCGR